MPLEITVVHSHKILPGEYRKLVLRAPQIARRVQPGQFVHLRVPRLEQAVLRRPFSVFQVRAGRLALLYKRVGNGTRALAGLRPGDEVSLLGPLGNGFPAIHRNTTPVLVAGGYGLAALYLLAQRASVKGLVFAGGAGADDTPGIAEFRRLGWPVRRATEDGSRGRRGLVTDALDEWLAGRRAGPRLEFFACGPLDLLRAVGDRARAGGWKAWLSLDRHMGCGLGACLACVQKVRAAAGHAGAGWQWARVCTEGPVFECREIVWDDPGSDGR